VSLTTQIVKKTATIEKRLEGMNRVEIQRRDQHAWSHACSTFFSLPMLRGFWSMSSVNENGDVYALSGQSRTLTYNGNPTFNFAGLIPYIDLDGVGDYLSRADEAGLDILGSETYVAAAIRGLTLGGWFYWAVLPGVQNYQIAKDDTVNRSYRLEVQGFVANTPDFTVWPGPVFMNSGITINAGWNFLVGIYDQPSQTLFIYQNGTLVSGVVGAAPAALTNSNAPLTIGASGAPGAYMTGRASMCFLCAASLSQGILDALYAQTRALFGV